MRTNFLPSLAALTALCSFSVAAAAPTIPDVVRRAVVQIFGGSRAIEHELEPEGDRYEVKARTELAVILDPAGSIVEIEAEIPVGLVPPAVLAAARSALPAGARVVEAELLVRGPQVLYELEARGPGGAVEMVLDAAGVLVSRGAGEKDGDDK